MDPRVGIQRNFFQHQTHQQFTMDLFKFAIQNPLATCNFTRSGQIFANGFGLVYELVGNFFIPKDSYMPSNKNMAKSISPLLEHIEINVITTYISKSKQQ